MREHEGVEGTKRTATETVTREEYADDKGEHDDVVVIALEDEDQYIDVDTNMEEKEGD
jgi:hypothetical protein